MTASPKVFGIGFHKTGTTTLAECFRTLGYDFCPEEEASDSREAAAAGEYAPCLSVATPHQAFEDSPWNYRGVFRILDVVFPGSKFILTVREENAWYNSIMRWVCLHGSGYDVNFRGTIGCLPIPENKEAMFAAYRQHTQDVASYFEGQPGKLLVADWAAGSGWKELCVFLGEPLCKSPFPHMLAWLPETEIYAGREEIQPPAEPAQSPDLPEGK